MKKIDILHPVFEGTNNENKILFLQIASGPIDQLDNSVLHDNKHCFVIFDELIFDANMKHPLPLTEPNVDLCCVGGPIWIFSHVSTAYEFTISPKTLKYIQRKKTN